MMAKADRKWGERQYCCPDMINFSYEYNGQNFEINRGNCLLRNTLQTCFHLSGLVWYETQAKCQCILFSSSRLQIAKPVMLGVTAVTHCRSDRENDRQGEFRRAGGGEELLVGDFLACGCRGGRQKEGDVETVFESSLLILLPELVIVTPIGIVLRLELVGLFDIPTPLFFKGKLWFLSKKLLWANKVLRFLV